MVDFICMGLLDLFGTRTENYKIKKLLLKVGFEPGTFRLRSESLSVELSELINIDPLKARVFYLSVLIQVKVTYT